MYTIHDFHGQPKDNGVNDKGEETNRHQHYRKRQQLHQRLDENIKYPDDKAGNQKKHNPTGVLDINQKKSNRIQSYSVQNDSKDDFLKHLTRKKYIVDSLT